MMKLSYMWDGHPTTFVVLSRYCLFHSLCNAGEAYHSCAHMCHVDTLKLGVPDAHTDVSSSRQCQIPVTPKAEDVSAMASALADC